MIRCIRLCLNCADVCTATAGVTSHPAAHDADVSEPLLEACVAICKSCGDECERHARMHKHCRVRAPDQRAPHSTPGQLVSGSGSRRLRCR
jgi:hypothetical protein